MALTTVDQGLLSTNAQYTGFKNRLINGDMAIDQRNNGASVTGGTTTFATDRWMYEASQSSKFTLQQNAGSVTPPVGFSNYLGITSSSAYSVTSGDYFVIGQRIEGFNVADLGFGTANAQTVTLSFWVRSSLTGTFGGALANGVANRSYPFTYTISAANTWEQKSITVPGDTSGTWLTNNGTGLRVWLGLGSGSTYSGPAGAWAGTTYVTATGAVSVVGTNAATFYITGCQLEKGSTATSFDVLPYSTELMLCQRYFEKSYNLDVVAGTAGNYLGGTSHNGVSDAGGNAIAQIVFKVPKRTNPTLSYFNADSGASGTWTYARSGASGTFTTLSDQPAQNAVNAYGPVGANWAACRIFGHWTASAEL